MQCKRLIMVADATDIVEKLAIFFYLLTLFTKWLESYTGKYSLICKLVFVTCASYPDTFYPHKIHSLIGFITNYTLI